MPDTNSMAPGASGSSSLPTTPQVVQNTTFNLKSPFPDDVPGTQSPTIHLAMTCSPIVDPANSRHRWLWISLNGTTVSATGSGNLIANTDSAIGWYLSQTTVKIQVGAGFTFTTAQPSTQQLSGSVTSSISLNLGVSGTTPSAGVEFSNSFTRNINDIQLTDHSQDSVFQTYTLNSSKGGPYSKPSDLMHGAITNSLYRVPDVAVANLPILTQTLWRAPKNFNGIVPVEIDITMELNFVTASGASPAVAALSPIIGIVQLIQGGPVHAAKALETGRFLQQIRFGG